jgi:ABC-type transporter MlaC component
MSRHFKTLTTAMFMVLVLAAPAWAECAAGGFVLNAGQAFMAAARSGSPGAFSGAASRYADLRGIALFALGPHRKKMSKAQEAQYVALTQGYMGRFMAKHSKRLTGSGLKVTGCSGNTVNASMASGKKLMFRVARARKGYRVLDVNVSSIWLAGTMRTTFVGVINRNGGDVAALTRFLRG